jgi:hypothetical protein
VAGATTRLGEFSVDGTSQAQAISLASAINSYPVVNLQARAEAFTPGKIAVFQLNEHDLTPLRQEIRVTFGQGFVLEWSNELAPLCLFYALQPGAMGNLIEVGLETSIGGTSFTDFSDRFLSGRGGQFGVTKLVSTGGAT